MTRVLVVGVFAIAGAFAGLYGAYLYDTRVYGDSEWGLGLIIVGVPIGILVGVIIGFILIRLIRRFWKSRWRL